MPEADAGVNHHGKRSAWIAGSAMTNRKAKVAFIVASAAIGMITAGAFLLLMISSDNNIKTEEIAKSDDSTNSADSPIVWDIRRGRDPRLFGVTAKNDGFHHINPGRRRAVEVVFRDDIRFVIENVVMAKVEVSHGEVESFFIRGPAMSQQTALNTAQKMTTHPQYIQGDVDEWLERLAKNNHRPFISAVLELEPEMFGMSLELIPDVTHIDPLDWAILVSATWIRPEYQETFRKGIWLRKHQPIKQYGPPPSEH